MPVSTSTTPSSTTTAYAFTYPIGISITPSTTSRMSSSFYIELLAQCSIARSAREDRALEPLPSSLTRRRKACLLIRFVQDSGIMYSWRAGWASNRRSCAQLLPDQRSNLGSEELDRANGFCMINMGDVQLETIDMHQLMQPDDLVGHGLGPTEEQGAFGPDQIFDGRIRHRGPATFLADLGERLAIRRQELRSCCALVGEDIAVAVYRQWRIRIMMPVREGLAVEIDERGKRRRPATDDRERHRQAERTGPDD